jgi:chemotaxis signal transduction protein
MVEVEAGVRLAELELENSRLRRLLSELPAEMPPGPFSALSFRRKDRTFALAAHLIREVVHAVWPEPAAEPFPGVLGRFVYEGDLVSLVDLVISGDEARASALNPSMMIVIVNSGTGLFGILADHVNGVTTLEPGAAVGLSVVPSARELASFLDSSGEAVHLLSPRRLAAEFCR